MDIIERTSEVHGHTVQARIPRGEPLPEAGHVPTLPVLVDCMPLRGMNEMRQLVRDGNGLSSEIPKPSRYQDVAAAQIPAGIFGAMYVVLDLG